MTKDKSEYKKVYDAIKEAKESIINKKLLSEDECISLIKGIKKLPDEEMALNDKEIKVTDVDLLMEEFHKYAEESKSRLEEMLETISNGRIPDHSEQIGLDDIIENLRDKYEAIRDIAFHEAGDETLPSADGTIHEFYDAIKNSKKALLRSQLNEAKETLEKYISVKSLIANLSAALEPFQKDAMSLLERINGGDINSVEDISEELAGPKLFLQALECDDLTSDEGNDMLDSLELNHSYPSRVTRGLSSNNYFLPEDWKSEWEAGVADADDIQRLKDNEAGIITTEEPLSPDTPHENGSRQEEKDASKEVKEGDEDWPSLESGFAMEVETSGLINNDKAYGILISDAGPCESKKVSASVFLNDIRKGNVKIIKCVIQDLEELSLVSSEIMEARNHVPGDMAESCLEFLQKIGYLRKYIVMPGGKFYCASPRLDKALLLKEASKFVGVKQHRADDARDVLEDKAAYAATRAALMRLGSYGIRNCNEGNVKKYSYTSTLYEESFVFKLYSEVDPKICELIVGEFWTERSGSEKLCKELRKIFEQTQAFDKIVFAGINQEMAKRLAHIIIDFFGDSFKNAALFLYGAVDFDFYEYDSGKVVSLKQVWPFLKSEGTEEAESIAEQTIEVVEKEGTTDGDKVDKINDLEFLEDEQHKEKEQHEKKQQVVMTETEIPSGEKQISEAADGVKVEVARFIVEKKYYCATAYAKAMANKDASYDDMYDLTAYAFDDPMRHCIYSADNVFDMIQNVHGSYLESLMVAIGIRTFFSNKVRYDYNIKALYDAIKSYKIFEDYPTLGKIVYKLVEFKGKQSKGMDFYADYHAKSIAQLDEELRKLQQEAKMFYENTILAKKSEKASQRRFLETKKMLFDLNGDIGQYVKSIVDNSIDFKPLLEDFLQKNFIKEGNVLSEDNIDSELLWNFITEYWEKAGEKMMYRFRDDLKSHLRNNIINVTTKALQIMIRWCNLIDKRNNQGEDSGSEAYKKIRKPLLDELKVVLQELAVATSDESTDITARAGLEAVRHSVEDVFRSIEGSYEEYEKKFFYVRFLLTDDVILDENYFPDLSLRSVDSERLKPENRIKDHANKDASTPTDRLKEILDAGDDYGTARLLVDYLRTTAQYIMVDGYVLSIEEGEEYAKETADIRRAQFIGDLELAYVSGQIDNSNSTEDKKEKILQIVDLWYEWACESSNYGFFRKVMDEYLEEIRRESKSREKDMIAQLDAFKAASITGLSSSVKEKKVLRIQMAINNQNYTVAEDLLAKATELDDEVDDIVEENFLRSFLDNYNDYFKPVAMSNTSFSTLVSDRTRNKEERGGKKLADNWLPGGGAMSGDRLMRLLNGLGFNVNLNSIQKQQDIGRFESFSVKTIAAKDGKRDNYTHPIAAFGSGASGEGFRVVCMNGKYDAAGLIDVMKQIGNAKHTMILLDCALNKPERHSLARKCRMELGEKLFVVLDRTVMMYLVKNYDETKINRMLMALVVPFGYYQPYVWESASVMPPEIFMGRKQELESIESPNGANIVYGGRQLGKSALLKKAKADIDRNENGDRAILVDIKALGYKEAAKKISNALYDEGILEQDVNTTDWNELSRALRKRLQSDKNRIPYLLLLLDEADAFIESCEGINFRPFDELKDVQSVGTGRFKFVIAGLRNIVRFKRDAALGKNSVLTHLKNMTVKPFKTAEARELMEVPLHYLGLEFPKENESLITLILASTNYFPGLIQMYCAKLLSAMRKKDYAGYAEKDTPIYEISEEHIKKVLADPEFMEQIKEKFVITLKLDEDNYYYLIALIMAYMYHNNGYSEGYSVTDIKETGQSLGISKIAELENERLFAFMEELKDLNVLRSTDDDHYLFTRFSFFQMMGTRTEVDDKLVEYMD